MPAFELDAQRLGDAGAITLQILARDRAADPFQIGGDLAPDVAAIEIVEPSVRQMIERHGERALLELDARLRRLAIGQEGLGKPGDVFQSLDFKILWLTVLKGFFHRHAYHPASLTAD